MAPLGKVYDPGLQAYEPISDRHKNSDEIDYNSMKVVELKELLKEKELPVSGTKAELIKRLQT